MIAIQPKTRQILGVNQQTYQALKASMSLDLRRQLLIAVCDSVTLQNQLATQLENDLALEVSANSSFKALESGFGDGFGDGFNDGFEGDLRADGRSHRLERLVLDPEEGDLLKQVACWVRQILRAESALLGAGAGSGTGAGAGRLPKVQALGIEQMTRQPAMMQNHFLRSLENVESLLPRLNTTLLVWVPRPWLRTIEQSAPTFWAWRNGVFEFLSDPTPTPSRWELLSEQSLHESPLELFESSAVSSGAHHPGSDIDSNGEADRWRANDWSLDESFSRPSVTGLYGEGSYDEGLQEEGIEDDLQDEDLQDNDLQDDDLQHNDLQGTFKGADKNEAPQHELSQRELSQLEPDNRSHVAGDRRSLEPKAVRQNVQPLAVALPEGIASRHGSLDSSQNGAHETAHKKLNIAALGGLHSHVSQGAAPLDIPTAEPANSQLETNTSSDVQSDIQLDVQALEIQSDTQLDGQADTPLDIQLDLQTPSELSSFELSSESPGESLDHAANQTASQTASQTANQAVAIAPLLSEQQARQKAADDYFAVGHVYRSHIEAGERSLDLIEKAIAAYEGGLQCLSGPHPDWGSGLNDLGTLYWLKAQQLNDPQQCVDAMAHSIELYQEALTKADPQQSGMFSQLYSNMGSVYSMLATYDTPMTYLQQAATAYSKALPLCSLEDEPEEYATLQNSLGSVYWKLSHYESVQVNLHRAVAAYNQALLGYSPERQPLDYAAVQNNLGITYWSLAKHDQPAVLLKHAIAAYRDALNYRTPEVDPAACAITYNNLALAYWDLSKDKEIDPQQKSRYQKNAVTAFEAALSVSKSASILSQADSAAIYHCLGDVHAQMAGSAASLTEIASSLQKSLHSFIQAIDGLPSDSPAYQGRLAAIVDNMRAHYDQLGLAGQQAALNRVPPSLLSQVMIAL